MMTLSLILFLHINPHHLIGILIVFCILSYIVAKTVPRCKILILNTDTKSCHLSEKLNHFPLFLLSLYPLCQTLNHCPVQIYIPFPDSVSFKHTFVLNINNINNTPHSSLKAYLVIIIHHIAFIKPPKILTIKRYSRKSCSSPTADLYRDL